MQVVGEALSDAPSRLGRRGRREIGCGGGRSRHRGIAGADQRKVWVVGCFGEMCANRLDGECAGNFAGVTAAHAVTDDIESELRVDHKGVFVVGALEAGIGLGAMHSFEGQTTPPLGRETLQAGTELAREFVSTPIPVRQFFL